MKAISRSFRKNGYTSPTGKSARKNDLILNTPRSTGFKICSSEVKIRNHLLEERQSNLSLRAIGEQIKLFSATPRVTCAVNHTLSTLSI